MKSVHGGEEEIWSVLDSLAAETAYEISLLLLLTPEEAQRSLASADCDVPDASKL